jgi:hypothetical protein
MFSEKIMKAIIALWNAAFGLSGAILCFVGAHILVQLGKYWEFIGEIYHYFSMYFL